MTSQVFQNPNNGSTALRYDDVSANDYVVTLPHKSCTLASAEGTTTNDNALAGQVGEYIYASVGSGSPVALSTTVGTNITSVVLTSGDWDVNGYIGYTGGATVGMLMGAVSLISQSLSGEDFRVPGFGTVFNSGTYGPWLIVAPKRRITLAATTTIYLVSQNYFSAPTNFGAYGTISARRVR